MTFLNGLIYEDKIGLIIRIICKKILQIIFCVVRVKHDRVILYSYDGMQYSDSPKYITQELLKTNKGKYEIIWAFNNVEKFEHLRKENIKLVKFKSFKYHWYLLTAKVIINNTYIPSYIPFKKEQYVIDTWHGMPYKKVGLDIVIEVSSIEQRKMELWTKSLKIMLSNSHFFSEIAHSAFLVPEQSMLKSGWPRNDIFFDFCKIKKNNLKVRKYFDCSQDEFIVLYAPTFRDDQIDRGYIDVESDVISALMEKFHKKVKVLLRGHHLIKNKTFSYHGDEIMADASDYEDMQELLCAADVLITDYSSCMWDFSLSYKPCFLLATDLKDYQEKRGLYVNVFDLPFSIALNNDELIKNILEFNNSDYVSKVKQYHDTVGCYEDGRCAKKIAEIIDEACFGKEIK